MIPRHRRTVVSHQTHRAAKGGLPEDRRPLGQSCATVARSLAHASTDDTAERHTEAQLLRHRPEAGGARRPTKGTQPLAHTDRRRSGHSEAKLGRWPSIQVGGHELRPRAAELVHKGGRVDGELLHDAHKLRVETERQVAREHVKLLTHRLVL